MMIVYNGCQEETQLTIYRCGGWGGKMKSRSVSGLIFLYAQKHAFESMGSINIGTHLFPWQSKQQTKDVFKGSLFARHRNQQCSRWEGLQRLNCSSSIRFMRRLRSVVKNPILRFCMLQASKPFFGASMRHNHPRPIHSLYCSHNDACNATYLRISLEIPLTWQLSCASSRVISGYHYFFQLPISFILISSLHVTLPTDLILTAEEELKGWWSDILLIPWWLFSTDVWTVLFWFSLGRKAITQEKVTSELQFKLVFTAIGFSGVTVLANIFLFIKTWIACSKIFDCNSQTAL